jgi:hypothetical protein
MFKTYLLAFCHTEFVEVEPFEVVPVKCTDMLSLLKQDC